MHRTAFVLLALLLLAAAPAAAQETVDREFGDIVSYFDDAGAVQELKKIRVDKATYEQVDYTTTGRVKASKPGNKILSITYGDAPRIYLSGLTALSRGQFAKAISDLDGAKNAVEAKLCRPWVLEYASLHKARALLGLGMTDSSKRSDAVAEFKAVLDANSNTVLFDKVQLGICEASGLLKRWDDATAAAETLSRVGEQTKNPMWKVSGQAALARVLLLKGQVSDAITAFDSLVALSQRELRYASGDILKGRLVKEEISGAVEGGWARISWAESSGEDSRWNEARAYFEKLRTQYPDSDQVAAAALNGIGRCILEKNPREALLRFVEAEVVHFTARSEGARSFYLKAMALEKLGGSRNREMAEQAQKDLREFYPDSEWAAK